MKGFETINAKSAVKSHNKFDLSRTHLTTMDFGQIVPLLAEETVPGDKFNIGANYFSRMAPLVKPTYGKFYFKTMASFVPYIQVADDIEGFLSGSNYFEGTVSDSRYIGYTDLVNLITLGNGVATAVGAGQAYDFTYINSGGNRTYWRLTGKGRYWWKILNSLGYVMPENVDQQSGSSWMTHFNLARLSALPLLAFAKAYNDWMSQSTYYNQAPLTAFLKNVKHNVTTTGYANHKIDYQGLHTILTGIVLCYENDYFTSAWQRPNQPVTGSYFGSKSFGNVPGQLSATPGSTDTLIGNEWTDYSALDSNGVISQRSLDFLKGFDDWVRRNNYSGSRAVQRVYSRFGIKTDDFRSNYAHVITTTSTPIQVGDVTAQGQDYVGSGNANNIALGDYAGKGIMNDQAGFSFQANDYGMLFIFGWYTVAPMNAYGMDKHVLRVDPFDFYNPEFDGVGIEPISVGEYFVNAKNSATAGGLDDAVYGYTERYNSYRYGRDKITGDFRTANSNATGDMNVWHTGRDMNAIRNNNELYAQSASVMDLASTDSEYNRIFSVANPTGGSIDHFYMTAQFNVDAVRPMLSLNQVPRLGEGDTTVAKNGNTIN